MKSLAALLIIMGCAACNVVQDNSMQAIDAGDYTLLQSIAGNKDATSNCLGLPNGGYDVCRFIEGATISSSWKIIVPNGGSVVGNQIIVYFKDIQKTYSATDSTITIPFADILQSTVWSKDLDGEVTALALIQYKDNSGIIQTSHAMGIARLLILPSSYSVLPLDSGLAVWGTTIKCKLEYSTAGRSAYNCK